MGKSTKITLVFILIFVVGVLGFVAFINHSLNYPQSMSLQDDPSPPLY